MSGFLTLGSLTFLGVAIETEISESQLGPALGHCACVEREIIDGPGVNMLHLLAAVANWGGWGRSKSRSDRSRVCRRARS